MTHEDMCCTPEKLLEFSDLYRQKPREHVWNNGGRNIKLSQAKLNGCGLTKKRFCTESCSSGSRKGLGLIGWLIGWLAKTWTKRWFPASELETLHLPRFNAEEGNQRLRELDC